MPIHLYIIIIMSIFRLLTLYSIHNVYLHYTILYYTIVQVTKVLLEKMDMPFISFSFCSVTDSEPLSCLVCKSSLSGCQ